MELNNELSRLFVLSKPAEPLPRSADDGDVTPTNNAELNACDRLVARPAHPLLSGHNGFSITDVFSRKLTLLRRICPRSFEMSWRVWLWSSWPSSIANRRTGVVAAGKAGAVVWKWTRHGEDARRLLWLAALVVVGWAPAAAAPDIGRFNTIDNGAVTFTGNTLGLDGNVSGSTGQNAPGTRGSIGTFITTDTTLRDTTPAPGWPAPTYNGTTNDWRLNGSTAVLRLPAGARVLYAELIWGGSFADTGTGFENVTAFINNPISFTTPAGTFDVTPDPATARNSPAPTGGSCSVNNGCFYVRTANVTDLVSAPGAGAGTYRVGRVPATQGTADTEFPSAGWTLGVVYEDFNQPIRSLTLFTGLERVAPSGGGAAAQVSGFCTPPSGPLSGRLAVTALEGDARLTGDEMRFGPTAPLPTTDR